MVEKSFTTVKVPCVSAPNVSISYNQVIKQLFENIGDYTWSVEMPSLLSDDSWVDTGVHQLPVNDIVFNTDKLRACSVEDGVTVVHSNARRGYGLAGVGIKSGCYEWKVTYSS